MAAPETENYLSVYKQFLKEFTSTVYPNDPLPVKVTGYILDEGDLEGEIIDWTRQYLNQRSCPPALATSVARSVLGELQDVLQGYYQLRALDKEDEGPYFDPLRLMQVVIAKVRAVCERYLTELEGGGAGSGALSIPPPLPGPPFVSTHAIKNHRRRMEDRHVSIEDLSALFGITTSPCLVGYYAIFDGHHGHEAAAYSAAQLHCLLVHSKHYPQDPEAALKDAFFRADEIFIKKCASSKFLSGTTALVALVRHRESLHVAWLGDSLGILVRKGGKVTQFVNPHTAERQDERDRILSAGGSVFQHFGIWRINGTLAISRAIGDPDCKPHVSALADVVSYPLDGSEHFMILACDGLWDCVTEKQATAFVYDHLRNKPENHADLSQLLVSLAKSRASNDNISVVVVLLSSVEDILASAPPPATLALDAREEDYCAAEASPADGLAPDGALPCQLLVNGAMDVEAATAAAAAAAADPSSNPFAIPFATALKAASPAAGPDATPSHPDGAPAPEEDRNNHHHHHDDDDEEEEDRPIHDEDDGLAMDYNSVHHSHHNGHGAGDIMTSSFYGNGGPNGEDARHLFGDPSDLGPETDVDLLDEDGMDVGQAAEEEYRARALEFGVEDGLRDEKDQQHRKPIVRHHPAFATEADLLGGGVYSTLSDAAEASRLLLSGGEEQQEVRRTDLKIEDKPVPFNPFAAEADDWASGRTEEIIEGVVEHGVVVDVSQFEEESSTRQHHSDVDRRDLLMGEEEEVIPYKEEPAVVKGEVVPDEEVIEVGGGSGLEEADDDSEEEGEWKYVSAKPGEGGAVVPEAVSPEAALPNETSCSPALPEQDLQEQYISNLSPALPPRPEALTPESTETEEFDPKAETCDLKVEEQVADDDKFCLDLGFEVVQKTHVEEVVSEPGLPDKPAEEEREPQVVPEEGDLQETKSSQQIEEESEDSTMESRLNPDAAEFVPVSPTPIVNSDISSFSGFNNDFDTFKKEAEACPGNVSEGSHISRATYEEPSMSSTPKALSSRSSAEDTEPLLSSSFTGNASNLFQDELNVVGNLTSHNDFHVDDDENKENLLQQGENKENMSQQLSTSDVCSDLNRSFGVFEEHGSGNDQVSDLLGSLNLSGVETKDESVMLVETSDLDKEVIQEELKQSSAIMFEVASPVENVSEAIVENVCITQPEEININQSIDFIPASPEEDIQSHVPIDGERFSVKENVQQLQDSQKLELSPEVDNPQAVETIEQIELLNYKEKIDAHVEDMPHPPILQICPMKVDFVKEEHVQSESAEVGREDFIVNKEPTTILTEDSFEVTPITTEAAVDNSVEPSVERIETEVVDLASESVVKICEEVEPIELPSVVPLVETVCEGSNFSTFTSELSSIIEGGQAVSFEENVPVVEEEVKKMEEVSESVMEIVEEVTKKMEEVSESVMAIVQEVTTQSLESNVCMPSSEVVPSPDPVEISLVDVTAGDTSVEVQSKEVVEESIPGDVCKAAAVGGAAAAVAAIAGLTAAAVASDAKPAAKKPALTEKKQVPDKSKPSALAAKAKSSSKPPVSAARTMAPKKAAPPTTSKTAPIPAARTATTERKPAASTAKPAATTTKPTTATSLSSKPRPTGVKSTTAPTTRVGAAAPRTTATSARPSTASSTATRPGVTTTSKPAMTSTRPSTAPPKTTEPKKMLNGDASKPTSTATTTSKPSPRKTTTSSSATAAKPLGSAKPLVTARGPAATGKTSTETAAAKTKQSSVSGTVNGAVPKVAKSSPIAGAKPSPTAPSRTKPAAPTKATAPSAPGIAKKAKESVNKHISATRVSGVTTSSQKSTSSPTAKASTTKGPAAGVSKTMANGTPPGKKAEVNSNSKMVEEKVELLISPHENGIAVDSNEMSKELEGVVGMEDGVHEAKEQMVLIGDSLSIGEAV